MSSPLSLRNKGLVRRSMVTAHKALSHNNRIELLAGILAKMIDQQFMDSETVYCLDVGCGDMTLAERIHDLLPRTSWVCIDLYELPEDISDPERWMKYRRYDGNHMPFNDKSIDLVLFCDVLHHTGGNAEKLLCEASRVSDHILVKDHFEYSILSRFMLLLLDFVGNWGYGVTLPRRYFSQDSFQALCTSLSLKAVTMQRGIDLYRHLPVPSWLLSPLLQFAVMLKHSRQEAS